MSNKIKIGKKKKSKKKENKVLLPEDVGKDKYFERHSYQAPDLKTIKSHRGKNG